MTTFIKARFDGRVFVPAEPIDLPAGSTVAVFVPGGPPAPTPADEHRWQTVLDALEASEPAFLTVEEALSRSRRRV